MSVVATAALTFSGCKKPENVQPATIPSPPKSLRLLIVDDPALTQQIGRVKGEWKARFGAELEIQEEPLAALAAAKALTADAVIFAPSEIGSLAERRLIRPIPAAWLNREELHKSDLFDPGGLAECQWGEQTFAVPFGSPVFVLMYRRDVFERDHLQPPRDWAEYQQVVAKLEGHIKESKGIQTAVIEPLAPGWAGKLLLARAASYAKHRDYYATLFDKETMAPQIDSPPFVRALEELIAATKATGSASLAATPNGSRDAVLSGRAAMAVTWPTGAQKVTAAPSAAGADSKPESLSIGFAELPGALQSYNPKSKSWETVQADDETRSSRDHENQQDRGSNRSSGSQSRQSIPLLSISGRIGSVTSASQSPESAFRLLCWLSGDEWSAQICPASPATTLFRRSHLDKPSRWVEPEIASGAAKQYAEIVASALSRPQWIGCLRIPRSADYMAALDDAVRAAVEGKQSPAEALSAAAKRWQETAAKIGIDSQRAAYIRSLDLEP
ncbi:MAG TPA: extracellular solute-binding protein [Pirellulales bacterium]|nr:extracellular solute-binding protein [Pirellulales bacterium]